MVFCKGNGGCCRGQSSSPSDVSFATMAMALTSSNVRLLAADSWTPAATSFLSFCVAIGIHWISDHSLPSSTSATRAVHLESIISENYHAILGVDFD